METGQDPCVESNKLRRSFIFFGILLFSLTFSGWPETNKLLRRIEHADKGTYSGSYSVEGEPNAEVVIKLIRP
jgi:hypothetical protein